MNYYEILEVSPKASPAVIRAAYRSLIQRYHPDKNPGDTAIAERAAQVIAAYEILSDEEKRAAYDGQLRAAQLRQGAAQTPAGHRRPRAARRVERPRRSLFSYGLMAVLLAVLGWMALGLFKTPSVEAVKAAQPARAPLPAIPYPEEKRVIEGFARDLRVELKHPGSEGSEGLLLVPVIDVSLGAKDPAGAAAHLNNIKEETLRELALVLAKADRNELLKPEGEAYLRGLIVDFLMTASGAARPAALSDSATVSTAAAASDGPRYGVVDVQLPRSYALR